MHRLLLRNLILTSTYDEVCHSSWQINQHRSTADQRVDLWPPYQDRISCRSALWMKDLAPRLDGDASRYRT
ncbi:hypothetical protein PHSY_002904 [Pseudozyma hubeiensis SY62]|uniref:Uncharacterized protein n=1 Tax=Pseudozyma hubeiensis (strain SY62) TaxID=1305764 RepID=R9P280_PSEHS|nr:hypothetical protein PHSY_002904 [Pseudozyma hubeiensis SY62]GAC95329.1 hypothetical protein PHSY_002904 [Pseudozyma hubeiensis SY62]